MNYRKKLNYRKFSGFFKKKIELSKFSNFPIQNVSQDPKILKISDKKSREFWKFRDFLV